ncbi:MAG: methylated-DNA--[protein]-cysteine S-methyltransferase [Pseudonocardia sp.]
MTGAPTMLESPVGPLTVATSDAGITHLVFGRREIAEPATSAALRWLDLVRRELAAYFDGRLRTFTVPADLERVTGERRAILDALDGVGYGETTSYGALAAAAGLDGDGARRVGAAMARNPVAIVVPCHRVIGADGSLTGYGGGLAAKRWLLDLEAAQPSDRPGQLALPL